MILVKTILMKRIIRFEKELFCVCLEIDENFQSTLIFHNLLIITN